MLKWVHKLYVIKNLGQCQSLIYSELNIVTIIVSLYINSGTPRDLEHCGNPKNEKKRDVVFRQIFRRLF